MLIISHSLINVRYDHFQDWACGNLAECKRNVQRGEVKFPCAARHVLFVGLWRGVRAGLERSVVLCMEELPLPQPSFGC